MARDILSIEDMARHLKLPEGDESEHPVLEVLIDGVVDTLETSTREKFTADGVVVTDEPQNGLGGPAVYADYPVGTLTTVKIGRDSVTPSVTLDGSDVDEVIVDPRNPRRIVRPGSGIFPRGVRNVFLTYTTAEHEPADAKLAILDAVAFLYRRRGSEDAASESSGGFSHSLLTELSKVPAWQHYLNRRRAPKIA